jgi:hypothetical protein
MELAPVRDAFRDVLVAIRDTIAALRSPDPMPAIAAYARFAEAAAAFAPGTIDPGQCSLAFGRMLRALTELSRWKPPAAALAAPGRRAMGTAWTALAPLGGDAAARIDEWLLGDFVRGELHGAGCPAAAAEAGPAILALLLAHPSATADKPPARSLLSAQETGPALRVNAFEGVRWFDRECFELLSDLLAVTACASAVADAAAPEAPLKLRTDRPPIAVTRAVAAARRLRDAGAASAWRWDDFRTAWLAAPEPKARRAAKKPAPRPSRNPPDRGRAQNGRKPRKRR